MDNRMTDERAAPELLPCPFCGGPVMLEKAHQQRYEMFGLRQFWGVVCRNTTNLGGTCCMEQVPSASQEAAIGRWNRRAPVAAPAADGLPALPKPPTLPRYLLDQIGDYGMARSDSIGQIEVQYRWEVLISYIKRYAGEYALDAIAADRRTRAGAESTSKTAETRMDTGSGASARVGMEHDHSEGGHVD